MKTKIFCIIFCVVIMMSCVVMPTFAYTPTNFDVEAEGALLINPDTDDCIYSKNADKRLYPASLTKLMTALLLYENTSDLDGEILTVSEKAIKLLQGTDSSIGGLKVGEQVTARQMLYILLLSSANDGANVIAEHVSGTIEAFVALMNKRASELGMANTHFMNAHGLHNTEHYTTVNDMYLLTKKFLTIPVLKEVAYSVKYEMPATNMSSARIYTTTNFLLLNNGQKCTAEKYKNQPYYYKYANGIKTGYTDPAGRCLISTATKEGMTYVCILMNSPVYENEQSKNNKIRVEFGDTKALYEWAFNEFEYKTVLQGGEIIGEAPVDLAWDIDFVSVSAKQSLSAIVPKVADSSTVSTVIRWYSDVYDAPIKKGDEVGECDVIFAGQVLGTVKLVASQNIERSNTMFLISKIQQGFNAVIHSVAFYVIAGIVVLFVLVFVITCVVINMPKKRKKKRRRY